MKLIEISIWRAVLGWPIYVCWNLLADAKEQQARGEKVKISVTGILFAVFTTAAWAAAWMTVILMTFRLWT